MNIAEQSALILKLTENLDEHIKEHQKFKNTPQSAKPWEVGYNEPKQTIKPSYLKREIVVLRAELNDLSKKLEALY